jgi:hypothetical protein
MPAVVGDDQHKLQWQTQQQYSTVHLGFAHASAAAALVAADVDDDVVAAAAAAAVAAAVRVGRHAATLAMMAGIDMERAT